MANKELFLHQLNKNNFFYDYITTLACSQFGVNEIFARSFTMQMIKKFPDYNERQKELQRFSFPVAVEEQILNTKTFTPMIFVPGFKTKSGQRLYRMDPDQSAANLAKETIIGSDVNLRLTNMTIISAYERVASKISNWSTVMEFFRHIRNAAAHNGKFYFSPKVLNNKTGELNNKAEWSDFKIIAQLQSSPLFPNSKDDQNSFWDQGDLIEFLLDFENHHPELCKVY